MFRGLEVRCQPFDLGGCSRGKIKGRAGDAQPFIDRRIVEEIRSNPEWMESEAMNVNEFIEQAKKHFMGIFPEMV